MFNSIILLNLLDSKIDMNVDPRVNRALIKQDSESLIEVYLSEVCRTIASV